MKNWIENFRVRDHQAIQGFLPRSKNTCKFKIRVLGPQALEKRTKICVNVAKEAYILTFYSIFLWGGYK